MGAVGVIKRSEIIRTLLANNARRYATFYTSGHATMNMAPVRDWFAGWHTELKRELAKAINEEDSIIGKQWHYDYIVEQNKLP